MEQISTSANFRIDWKELKIVKKELLINLGLPHSTKRENVYDSNNVWIDTRPVEVIDLGSKDATNIYLFELLKKNEEKDNDKKTKEEDPTEGQKTKPTLYNTKEEALKALKVKTEGKKDYKPKPKDYKPKPDEP